MELPSPNSRTRHAVYIDQRNLEKCEVGSWPLIRDFRTKYYENLSSDLNDYDYEPYK
jgi:hypothetical protein